MDSRVSGNETRAGRWVLGIGIQAEPGSQEPEALCLIVNKKNLCRVPNSWEPDPGSFPGIRNL
jgi:hypothetical protein